MAFESEHPCLELNRMESRGSAVARPPSRRRASVPPPLPRSAPASAITGAGSPGDPLGAADSRTSVYPAVVVEASTAGPPHHHRSGALTTLVLVAGAALLVAPMLAGLQRAYDAPEPAPLGLHRSASMPQAAPAPAAGEPEDDTAVFEQFIELDEVLITSTDEDGLEGER